VEERKTKKLALCNMLTVVEAI